MVIYYFEFQFFKKVEIFQVVIYLNYYIRYCKMSKFINFSESNFDKKYLCIGETNDIKDVNKNKVLVIMHIINTNKSFNLNTDDVKSCFNIIDKIKKVNPKMEITYFSYEKTSNTKNDVYSDFGEIQNKVNSIKDFTKNYKAVVFFHNNKLIDHSIHDF